MWHGSVARCLCVAAGGEQERGVRGKRAVKWEMSPRSLQRNVREQIPTGGREQGCGCAPAKSRLRHRLANPPGVLICECGHRWAKTTAGSIPRGINACPLPGPGWGMDTAPQGLPTPAFLPRCPLRRWERTPGLLLRSPLVFRGGKPSRDSVWPRAPGRISRPSGW